MLRRRTSIDRGPENVAGFNPWLLAEGCSYDPDAAERAVDFFPRCLTYVDDYKAGQPMELEPWQQDLIRVMFGWKKGDRKGPRRFRQSMIGIPRKNGKTTLAAGLALYLLAADGLFGAQVYCAAGDREQASIVYKFASLMAQGNPFLKKATKSNKTSRTLTYARKNSILRAMPANEGTIHGTGPSGVIGDEVHVWRGRDVYDALHTGTGHRMQPLEVYITTAGWDQLSICWELWQYAIGVRDGRICDPSFLPILFAAEDDDDWTDPAVWAKANPNLGVSIRLDYLEAECEKAKANPAYENTFRRLHLNQWTSQESRWLKMEDWKNCEAKPEPIESKAVVYGGLDLSSTTDFTAWVLTTKQGDGRWKCWGHYFLPERRAREYEKNESLPISQWVKEGWLTLIPGSVVDVAYVHRRIIADAEKYQIELVGYDPWNAEHSRQHLENSGLTMVEVRQGVASLGESCKALEKAVVSGKLDHSEDPVMRWMAENVQVKTDDNGNIRPVKPAHGSVKKIDGISALATAIAAGGPVDEATSIYNEPGAMIL